MSYLSNAQMDKEIKSLANRGAKFQNDVQRVAMSAINAINEHGNVFYVNKLYTTIAAISGVRSASLAQWLLNYGRVVANQDMATKDTTPFLVDKSEGATVDLEGAAIEPWYMVGKPEKKPDELVHVNQSIRKLISQIKKKQGRTDNEDLCKAVLRLESLLTK